MLWWMVMVAHADVMPRVVGGVPVAVGDWREVAAIVFDGRYVGCTGTLIAPDAVLTAGHCADDITHVIVGATDYNAGGEWIEVAQVFEHPDSVSTYDVAVLKLAAPASVAPRPVAMDCVVDEFLDDGAPVAVVGYGATDPAGTVYGAVLNEAFTEVADADCSEDVVDGFRTGCKAAVRPSGEVVAGGDGVDSCFGDSGGPLYLLTPSGDFLVGATSRGLASAPYDEPCLHGGIYTRPDAVIDWIEAQVGPVEKPVCNQPPEPVADPIALVLGGAGATRVRVGDPDARTGTVSYRIVSDPAHGTAEVESDGTVSYRAEPGFTGEDLLVVEVDDGGNPDWPRTGSALTGWVEIPVTVTATPPAPRMLAGPAIGAGGDVPDQGGAAGAGCSSVGVGGGWAGALLVLVALRPVSRRGRRAESGQ